MAQFSPAELQEIINRDLPGHTLIERAPSEVVANSPAESVSPSFDAMQNRFFGESSQQGEGGSSRDIGSSSDVYGVGAAGDGVPDDQIVLIENQSQAPSDDPGTGPKAVVISGSQRRIIGAQG
ncbi:hypothetical protein IAD21_03298 [Abditibacteriota bacterium]|nr:hypothetical protein IAD21_03298 [Abditibacteriota bacterium]